MKILLLADFDLQGGTGTYYKRIVHYLTGKGSVHAVLSKQQYNEDALKFLAANNVAFSNNLIRFPFIENIVMRVFRKIKLLHWYQYIRDYIIMCRLSKVYRPDIIFISQGGGDRYFAFLKAKCKVIMVCHSLWMENYNNKIFGSIFRRFITDNINIHDKRIITVSNYARFLFTKDFPKTFSYITSVVPNYAEIKKRYDETDSIIPTDNEIIVLTLGHMSVFKNPSVWIKTVSIVHKKYEKKVKFIWAGRPLDWKQYREAFSKEENADFIGFIQDPSYLYKKATIYFQPSVQESQGIAVIEAMAYGIPCVVSTAGGLPESITDGEEGFVRDPSSPEEFAECIITLLSNKELLKRMGLSAKNKYESCFTKTSWQTKMDAIFAIN